MQGWFVYLLEFFFVKKQTDRLKKLESVVSEMVGNWHKVKNTTGKEEKNTFETNWGLNLKG